MSREGGKGPGQEPGEEGGFAGRWSRRKQAAKAPAAEPAAAEADTVSPAAPEPDGRPDAEILEELGLPEPESLKPGDDFSAFMAKAVPERIRNRALRRLWLTDPVLANVDGLVDYGGDFTDAATVVENLQTLYKAGKGYFDRVAEGEAAAKPAEDGDAAGQATPEEAASGQEARAAAQELASAPAGQGIPDAEPGPAEWPAVPVASRAGRPRARMRFRVAQED